MPLEWSAWRLDWPTIAFLAWVLWFVVWEGYALWTGQLEHTWTWHIRPFLAAHPLAWWLAFGGWLWLGIHFLAPRLELRMIDYLMGR